MVLVAGILPGLGKAQTTMHPAPPVATPAPSATPAVKKTMDQPLEGYRAECNLIYAKPDGIPQYLDLYVPAMGKGPFTLLVWVHGGGWAGGYRNIPYSKGALVWPVLKGNYAYATIEYRLSRTAIFPAQIEDCKSAIRWLRANAAKYNLDPDRIGVWGGSAGGHLVALLGTTGGVKTFDVGENTDVSSRVQAVCDFFGPTDFLELARMPNHEGKNLLSAVNILLGGDPLDIPEKAKQANPITFISKDTAPFLIIHGTTDGTVPPVQSQLLYDALVKAGVEARLHYVPNAGHGGPAFETPEIGVMVEAFFDQHLKKADGGGK